MLVRTRLGDVPYFCRHVHFLIPDSRIRFTPPASATLDQSRSLPREIPLPELARKTWAPVRGGGRGYNAPFILPKQTHLMNSCRRGMIEGRVKPGMLH